jgi:hypothetical protein
VRREREEQVDEKEEEKKQSDGNDNKRWIEGKNFEL